MNRVKYLISWDLIFLCLGLRVQVRQVFLYQQYMCLGPLKVVEENVALDQDVVPRVTGPCMQPKENKGSLSALLLRDSKIL